MFRILYSETGRPGTGGKADLGHSTAGASRRLHRKGNERVSSIWRPSSLPKLTSNAGRRTEGGRDGDKSERISHRSTFVVLEVCSSSLRTARHPCCFLNRLISSRLVTSRNTNGRVPPGSQHGSKPDGRGRVRCLERIRRVRSRVAYSICRLIERARSSVAALHDGCPRLMRWPIIALAATPRPWKDRTHRPPLRPCP